MEKYDDYIPVLDGDFTEEGRIIPLQNGGEVILPILRINSLNLFNGAAHLNLNEINSANETTIGKGVYLLTSRMSAAAGYARIRTGSWEDKKPVIYTISIKNLTIADLRTRKAEEAFADLFKESIIKYRDEKSPILKRDLNSMVSEVLDRRVSERLDLIENKSFKWLNQVTLNINSILNTTLTNLGFDGLVAIEGGERSNGIDIGDHDSFVIFDQNNVKIIGEQPLLV